MPADNTFAPETFDQDTWKIMKVIADQQETTTTEIKQKTDLEKNHRILYRVRKLERIGWIRIHQPGNDTGGVSPPNQYSLVRHKVNEYLNARPERDELSLDERLERVEEKIETLDGGLEDDIIQLKTDVSAIKTYLIEELNITESDLMRHHKD